MFSLTYVIQTRKKKKHEERRLPVSETERTVESAVET